VSNSIFKDKRDGDKGGNRRAVAHDGSGASHDESVRDNFVAVEVPAVANKFRRGKVVRLDGSKES
jgi:hypothetical protein